MTDFLKSFFGAKKADPESETAKLFDRVKLVCNSLTTGYNSQTEQTPLQLNIYESADRLVLSNSFWVVSIRVRDARLEFFLLPAAELSFLQKAETAPRLKLRLQWKEEPEGWHMDDMPVQATDIDTLIGTLFKDLCNRSQSEFAVIPESMRYPLPSNASLTGSIRSLVKDKQHLVQAIVNQQEEIQKRIAWDIHDAVLGDVLGLKRTLSDDHHVSSEEICKVLDRVTKALRQICHELTPRDLTDLGLLRVLEDLTNQLAERTGMDCTFNYDTEAFPDLPEEVQLHIYRIVQEALHNILKHAQATRVIVACELEDGKLTVSVADNGRGFDLSNSDQRELYSGSGVSIARERTELISRLYPANLRWDSTQGGGTTVRLQVFLTHKSGNTQNSVLND